MVVGGSLTLIIALSAIISRAQQDTATDLVHDPTSAITEEQSAARLAAQRQVLLTSRVPHAACAACFKVGDGRYGIYEEVQGTGVLIPREIPDPAPLRKGRVRPSVDEEGEAIWYIGDQGFVGPTDEEPVSVDLPIPKIELRRIQARHMEQIFSIPGVHVFGIGVKGFVVSIDPEQISPGSRIPDEIENIPVIVEQGGVAQLKNHANKVTRPVPVGAGISTTFQVIEGPIVTSAGTLGPHVVRDLTTPGIACCQIWSLTAAHVIQDFDEPIPVGRLVYQPTNSQPYWGKVAHSWSLISCGSNCGPTGLVNWTDQNPDVAAIAHIDLNHSEPPTNFVPTGNEPIRRMIYGTRWPSGDYESGPSGLIRTPGIGTSVKMWGAYSGAVRGSVDIIDGTILVQDTYPEQINKFYRVCCVDRINIPNQRGDSGALVAHNGTGNRHVAGIFFAGPLDSVTPGAWFTKAFDIQTAFMNAGQGFHYYWGTAAGQRLPASTQCDGGC
jgi:hypothetical protein